jgi:3-oxoadipate enol-lactonase
MGGMIGQTYALAHPQCFESLILADSTSRRPANAASMWGERIQIAQTQGMQALVESTLARWFTEGYRKSHPEVMARIGKGILETPVNGFCGCCDAISKIDLLDRLHEIKCTSLIKGEQRSHSSQHNDWTAETCLPRQSASVWVNHSNGSGLANNTLSTKREPIPKS